LKKTADNGTITPERKSVMQSGGTGYSPGAKPAKTNITTAAAKPLEIATFIVKPFRQTASAFFFRFASQRRVRVISGFAIQDGTPCRIAAQISSKSSFLGSIDEVKVNLPRLHTNIRKRCPANWDEPNAVISLKVTVTSSPDQRERGIVIEVSSSTIR
jgi:hypothetical protein